MRDGEITFWVGLPPGARALTLLRESAGFAEPLLDLRYGSSQHRRAMADAAIQEGLAGLTVFVDAGDVELLGFLRGELGGGSRIILASAVPGDGAAGDLVGEFHKRDIDVAFEVDSRTLAADAVAAGADFLVASGNEAYGPVSAKTSLVLLAELLEDLDVPLVVRGSLGPWGAAAALAAGGAGCILDTQVLLVSESPLSAESRQVLGRCSPHDTALVGALLGRPCRFLSAGGARAYRELADREKDIFRRRRSAEEKARAYEQEVLPRLRQGFEGDSGLLPVGQGIAFAQQFAEEGRDVREVLAVYRSAITDSIGSIKGRFPLSPGSALAEYHGVRYPIVQGPMAGVCDNPRLATAVAREGALPFVAAAGLSAGQTRELIVQTRAALGERPFGVGLIGFADAEESARQLEGVLAERPRFVTVAGGDAGLAHRLEEAGIGTYLHAPSVAHVKDLLNKGVRSIILEGHEAGGHVGALGSLVLWELGAREVAALAPEEAASTRVLLAGGIGGVRGALAAAVLASRIEETGAGVGIQIGTAYLMTDDAATSGAVPPRLQAALLRGENTIVSGRSVNLPARWLECPGVRGMVEQELAWESEGLPLPQRKALAERAVLEHLRGALVGRGEADEAGAEVAAPEGVDQPEQAEFMCGQVIATRSHPFTISALHEELTAGAQELAGRAASLGAGADEVAQDAVAIIGIGCIFPKANDASEYWTNILRGVSAIKEVPEDRWDPKVYYDPSRENLEKSSSKLGAFVEGFRKDPVKFRIPPVSEPSIERIQFATLEVARQALDDAGYLEKGFPRERTGVILGTSTGSDLARLYALRSGSAVFFDALKSVDEFTQLPGDLSEMIARKTGETLRESLPEFTEDSCPGVLGSIVAGRVSNYFNLGGSSFTVDGACASSLTAVSLAVAGLRNGQYDLVLAGGSDFGLDPATYTLFSSLQALSDTGSFPFDERADGFVMGEGAGLILLKRLPDAIRDGDKIYAVVRGIGSSSDGSARSVTAPDPKGQVRAILGAYEGLPFGPGSVSLVEAHGTATVAGDHAEITSLSEVFREYVEERKSVALGSVKSMIGHLKTAAGVAGLIKTALALHHRVLPPTINCEQPRSGVDWDNLPLYLNTEPCPWDAGDGPRRAAVNAFGFGGVNYHVVLEEAPGEHLVPAGRVEPGEEAVEAPAEVLTFRAPSRAQLLEEVGAVLDGLGRGEPASLRAVSSQLRQHASTHGPTLAVVAAGADELRGRLEKAWQLLNDGSRTEYTSAQGIYYGESRLGADEKIAFLFPGQGAQYVNMAGDLANCFPAARETLRKVDSIVHQWSDHSVLPAIQCEEGLGEEELQRLAEQLIRADYNHPALLTMGIVISDILRRAGVRPHLLAGHSVGEYSALEAAGVFDLEAAVAVICARGSRFYEHSLPSGAMASVAAPSEQTEQVLSEVADFVRVANRNCPAQTVISGDVKGIENVVRRFEQLGIQCKRLAVSSGFHTPLFSSFVAPFRQFLDKVAFRAPALPVQCNLTGEAYPSGGDFADAMRDALARHMISPVEFISNVESMYRNGARLFIEIGPGSTLCSFVDSILGDRPHWTFPTNLPRRSASVQLLHALAFCAAKGLDVDPEKVLPRPRTKDRLVASRQAPARPAAETKHQAVGPPALLREALSGQDDRLVRDYVSQRGDFLRDMVRLDFQHFAGEQARPGGGQARGDGLERQVIELVSRRTGYPPEIIDLDLDVEAELGLDSIKQVEIVRELESTLGVDLVAGAERAHRRITTLRDVVETFREQLPERVPAAGPETGSQHAPHGPEGDWNVDSHRWVSEALEAPLTGGGASEALAGRKMLVVGGPEGPGGVLAGLLEEAGASVSVAPASQMAAPPDEGYDTVIDMSSLGEDESPTLQQSSEWWERAAERGTSLLRIAQNLIASAEQRGGSKALWVEVTSLGGELGARRIECVPALAGIGLGISRCLFAEHSDDLDVLYIDFDSGLPGDRVAQSVAAELTHERRHIEIGYFGGKRFEIHWKPDDSPPQEETVPLDSESVVLAVGGARGITASICRELARRFHPRVVVVGKSPQPDADAQGVAEIPAFEKAREDVLEERQRLGRPVIPADVEREAWQRVWAAERVGNLSALRNDAASVLYRQCDITDARAVARLVREVSREFGRIDVVIQGSGGLVEDATAGMAARTFVEGMKPKALGTACLMAAVQEVGCRAFINLTSVVGRWGYMGLSAYAAGHEIASALVAGARGTHSGQWLNIFYGPWLGVGMTRQGAVLERLRDRGGALVTEEAGCELFITELQRGASGNVAFRGTEAFGVLLAQQSWRGGETPLFDELAVVAPGVAEGRTALDPHRDRFVADHIMRHEPIVPGTVMLEMMAQTAALLADPEHLLTDLEDVAFVRVVRFPRSQPRHLLVRARATDGGEDGTWLDVQVLTRMQVPGGEETRQVVHARCRARFGVRQAPPKPALVVVGTGLGDSRLDMKPFWSTKFASGRLGAFRNMSYLSSVTTDGVIGEVMAADMVELGEAPLTGDPIRLDGLVFTPDLLSAVFSPNASHYVAGAKAVRFFGAHDAVDARLVRARKREGTIFDVEGIDSLGRVRERMVALQKVPSSPGDGMDRPEPIWDAVGWNPQLDEIAGLLGYGGRLALTQVPVSLVGAALEGPERDEFLNEQLSSEELDLFGSLSHPKRQLEWLAGRIAAKGAVRVLGGAEASPASTIIIRSSGGNVPQVVIGDEGDPGAPRISIAHSGDVAAAAAAYDGAPGIDVEELSLSITEIADEFCTQEEVDRIVRDVKAAKLLALMDLWAAKEAVRKAVGAHTCSAKDLLLASARAEGGYIVCRFSRRAETDLMAVTLQSHEHVYAVSLAGL